MSSIDKDIEERDAFVERLLERDEKKTKHHDQKKDESKDIRTLENVKDTKVVDKLREISRQQYLEKREEKEINLLEMAVRDEEYLFDDVILTEEEKKKIELNKKIISLARDKQRFDYKDDGYLMPDAYEDAETGRIDKKKREGALTARYEEEDVVKSEQEQWEEEQVRKSSLRVGSSKTSEGDEYDYVFEDQIDFVSTTVLSKKKRKADGTDEVDDNNMGAREDDETMT